MGPDVFGHVLLWNEIFCSVCVRRCRICTKRCGRSAFAEPAAGILKNSPRLAKRPAFLWNVRIIGTWWAAVGAPVVTAGFAGRSSPRQHNRKSVRQPCCSRGPVTLGFLGSWTGAPMSQDTVTMKSHAGINMVCVCLHVTHCCCIYHTAPVHSARFIQN